MSKQSIAEEINAILSFLWAPQMLISDSWLSLTSLVWRVLREKRDEILPIVSLLFSPPSHLISFLWVKVKEGLSVGPVLLF